MKGSIICAALLVATACGGDKTDEPAEEVETTAAGTAAADDKGTTTPAANDEEATPPAADKSGWREHVDAARGFRVVAPAKPKVTKTTTPTVAGPAPTTQMMFQPPTDQRMGLMVMVADITVPESFDLEGGLNGTRDGMVRSMAGSLTDETKLELAGVPARDIVFTANNPQLGPIVARARFAYRGDTMYTALAMTRQSDSAARTEIDRFVDSFQLIERDEKTPGVTALAKATQAAGSAEVKVSAVELDVTEKKFGKDKGGYYLKVSFDAEAAKQLDKTQQVQVEAACMADGKTEVSKGSTMGDKLHELAPGQKKRADTTPFILTPLTSPPVLCNLTFSFRKSFREQVPIGDFCYREGAIAEGRCGDVL